jgi:predicted RNase H-like nuclease
MKTAGIDGCKYGWILISFDEGQEHYEILKDAAELESVLGDYDRVFIDMPVGLEEESYTRQCDLELRKALGSEYSSSVFSPPIRPALYAPTYAEANMTSYEYTEKKLTLQSWNITPKIRVLDELLIRHEDWGERVLESHPEWLFNRLNGGIIFQKKNLKKGIRHRLELLSEKSEWAEEFFRIIKEEYRRSEVGEDDIVDAMVLAFYANKSVKDGIKTIPEEPPVDGQGLPMAIHYV